jgi:hypothetical protein
MEKVQPKDLSPENTWEQIIEANVSWGSSEQANRVHVIATAKLAKTILSAGQSADRLNKKIYWLNWIVVVLGAIQLWPIVK